MTLAQAAGASLALVAFFLPLSIFAINAALALMLLCVLAAWTQGRKPQFPWPPAAWALGGYLAVFLAASTAGLGAEKSLQALPKELHKLGLVLAVHAALRLAGPCAATTVRFMGAGFATASLVGIGQTLFVRQAGGELWTRAHGFVHPVAYGEMLALGLLGGLCLLVAPEADLKKPSLAAFLALCGSAFLLNQTRGAFLAAAAGFLAVASFNPTLKRWLPGATLAGLALLILWEFLPTGRSWIARIADHGLSATDNPQFNRLVFWKVAWGMFLDHPWLGVGPGHYQTAYADYFQGRLAGQWVWGSAHNLYLHQLAERGLLGLGALLAVLTALTWRAYRRARKIPDGLNLWALSACAAFWTMNLTEVAFQNEQVTTLFLFLWTWAEARHSRNSYNGPDEKA